jgi:hypothetical protein
VSTLNVDKVDPSTGTALELGTSGDTITVPTGAGLTVTDEVKTNKVSPATGTAFALGDSGDTFTVPSGATIVNSGTATGFGITSSSFLPTAAPLIINGDFAVAQRSTSATGKTTSGYYATDRNKITIGSIGTYTIAQEALTSGAAYTAGFSTAFRIDCTTADASPAASDEISFDYHMEGQDLQLFKKGTANAEKYTLAFWVKSNQTGVGQVNLQDRDNFRMCSATYTIAVADTWEHKVLNYAADTTGVLDNDNGQSFRIDFWLDSGSDYKSGTAPTAWEAAATGDKNASGTLAIADSTSNDWAITGLQLEVGEYSSSDLPPFRHESYGNNLLRCERYYQIVAKDVDQARLFNGYNFDGTNTETVYNFSPQMRASPSIDQTTGASYFEFRCNNSNTAMTSFGGMDNPGKHAVRIYGTGGGGSSAGQAGSYRLNNITAQVCLQSEL